MRNSLLKPDGIKKNFIFQMVYKIVILVIPLVVSPYLTRTLGSTSLGSYTYTYSIAYYFVVFSMLGIDRHGQRVIAQRRNDYEKLRTTFWSLYFVHLIASVFFFILYLLYVLCICESDVTIAMVQAIYVFSAVFDITWLFYGLEKFKMVSIRNAVIKVSEALCIFAFVKTSDDVVVYTMIMCVSTCLGHIILLPQVLTAIPPVKFKREDVAEHIKPLIVLFAGVIAVTMYTMFDKTLLGIMSTKENVAFYEYADKIINIPKTFVAVVGVVFFPKACSFVSEQNSERLKQNFIHCVIAVALIGYAFSFGIASVADNFVLLYYGEQFAACGRVMFWMTPLILIIGIGDTVRQNYIYPMKRDIAMLKILFVNAATNLVLSIALIPFWGIYGAVAGTLGAEIMGFILQMWVCRKDISVKELLLPTFPFLAIGVIMYFVVKIVGGFTGGEFLGLFIQVAVGAMVYLGLTFIYGFFFNETLRSLIDEIFVSIRRKFGK